MEAKAKLAPPVQAGWTAGDTALLSPRTKTSGTDRPLWERTECSDSSSPLVPFIKETVRKDTMQENTNHPSHQAERSTVILPFIPPPPPQFPNAPPHQFQF